MEEGNFYNNQQIHKRDNPFLPSLDDQNASLPIIIGESLSHNKHMEQGVAPHFAPPLGSMSTMGDRADGLNKPLNNIQGSMPNPFEPIPQTQGPICTHEGPGASTNHPAQNHHSKGPIAPFREHDLYMPIANVVRIMRRGLPPHAKVADEAKEMVQECVSEFISFITSEANETCQLEHRKTITAEDVIGAMSRLGFEHYVEPLSNYLQKYRDSETFPVIPRRSGGPPIAMVHPQYAAMFGAPSGNGGSCNDGSGTSSRSKDMGHRLEVDNGNVGDHNGPNLALGIGGEPNDSEEGSPSGPPHDGLDFYYP